MKILVTGGAGFIGSCFVRLALKAGHQVLVFDALTYAGHRENLEGVLGPQCTFVQGDIRDGVSVQALFKKEQFESVVHFAAESHVDNSILGPQTFLETNILGGFHLLEASRSLLENKSVEEKKRFRFVQVSTDEVYGSLGATGKFSENSPHLPNSPYSASKAAADHLARAWYHTYGIPTITTNCSNNYGPRQFPEKLIPVMIQNCLAGKSLPVYGDGGNVRDWIHVEDHCQGVLLALAKGTPGETYCFGGNSERNNLQVVRSVCALLDQMRPQKKSHLELISFVKDRPGHDWRYAIDDSKAQSQLGFKRRFSDFEQGLKETVAWYLENQEWVQKVSSKKRNS